jgi:NAD(P)-dependent dehydrogenase (short-subunit alcohol dehydrogenase family)
MIREGAPTYGPSKAALEAFSAIMAKDLAGTGVTVNVLVPGGVTNTGMVPLEAGYNRAEMIQPAVMAPPLNWLVSDAAGGVTGRRFLAAHWDPSLPPEEAAAKAGAPVAWTEIATLPIEAAAANLATPDNAYASGARALARRRGTSRYALAQATQSQAQEGLLCVAGKKIGARNLWMAKATGNTIFRQSV